MKNKKFASSNFQINYVISIKSGMAEKIRTFNSIHIYLQLHDDAEVSCPFPAIPILNVLPSLLRERRGTPPGAMRDASGSDEGHLRGRRDTPPHGTRPRASSDRSGTGE